jgi:hypothetical protein
MILCGWSVLLLYQRTLDERRLMFLICRIDEERRQALKVRGIRSGEGGFVFGEEFVEAKKFRSHVVLSAPQSAFPT